MREGYARKTHFPFIIFHNFPLVIFFINPHKSHGSLMRMINGIWKMINGKGLILLVLCAVTTRADSLQTLPSSYINMKA